MDRSKLKYIGLLITYSLSFYIRALGAEGCRENDLVYPIKIAIFTGILGGNRPQYAQANPLPIITGNCTPNNFQRFGRITNNGPYLFTEHCGFTTNFDNNGPNLGGYVYGHTVYYDVVNCTLDKGLILLVIPLVLMTWYKIRNIY